MTHDLTRFLLTLQNFLDTSLECVLIVCKFETGSPHFLGVINRYSKLPLGSP